jgi:hypothetical protein
MSQPEKNLEHSHGSAGRIAEKVMTGNAVASAVGTQLHNSDELKAFKNVDPQVSKIYERLAGADEKIRSLERDVYALKASALGITNPEIRRISLKQYEYFPSNTVGTKGPTFIGYTIVGFDKDSVSIRVDVRNARNNVVRGQVYVLPLAPGKVQRVMSPIVGMPHLLLTVLEQPTPDIAVIAAGQPETDASKARAKARPAEVELPTAHSSQERKG